MKDLDFDELDKAVNSLMSGVPKNDPPKDDNIRTLTIGATLPPAPIMPQTPPAVVLPEPVETSPIPSPSAPLAARRGGRFMDVVHPSSDMTKASPSYPVSRQGVTIAPRPVATASDVSTDSTVDEAVAPVEQPPRVVEDIVVLPMALEASVAPTSDWPDPLEITEPVDLDSAPVAAENAMTIPQPADVAVPAQLNSPFLSDAKVEKRPLGGPTVPESDLGEELSYAPVLGVLATENISKDDIADQLPPTPPKGDMPLQEELQGDLMAIESDSHPIHQTIEPDTAPVVTPAATSPRIVPVSSPASTSQAGPSSIAQQYKEEPNSGDQTSGAIFDTASYHQPLSHPAKKTSGWVWVIAVVVILLLGAGGGAALYFLGIV
jgi:hypothetical protein